MRHSTLHALIILTTMVTAIIHLVVLSYLLGEISPLFVLNGLGFLILLGAWYFTPGFLANQRTALHIVFILYTIVTIAAWVAIGDTGDALGIFTKLDEALGFGVILNCLQKADARLSYVTTGQDVPNDIAVGESGALAELILGGENSQAKESPACT